MNSYTIDEKSAAQGDSRKKVSLITWLIVIANDCQAAIIAVLFGV